MALISIISFGSVKRQSVEEQSFSWCELQQVWRWLQQRQVSDHGNEGVILA